MTIVTGRGGRERAPATDENAVVRASDGCLPGLYAKALTWLPCMSYKMEAVATLVILAGFLLFNTAETALVGALLVAGGAYALILPQFIEPHGPATR